MSARRPQAARAETPSPEHVFDVPSPGWPHGGDSLHLFQAMQNLTQTMGGLSAKVDRLIADVEKSGMALQTVEKELVRGKAILGTMAIMLPLVGTVLWWLLGEQIERARDQILDARPALAEPRTAYKPQT